MGGRYEKEVKINSNVEEKLKRLPSVVSDYYYSLVSSGKSYITAQAYVYNIEKFLEAMFKTPYKEDFYVKVNTNHINRYMSSLRMGVNGKRMSGSYLTTKWSALNSFFDFLVPSYIAINPVAATKRPKQKDNPDVTFLNEKEISMIFDNVKDKANRRILNRDLAILKLGFATGLRVSEIVQIDLNDIDFNNNKINIVGKGDRGYYVFIGNNLKNQIKLWLDDRNTFFNKTKTDALFVSQEYNRLSVRSVNDLIARYSDVVDKHVTPHVMRHSCATNLYEKTGDIYLCASQLHHKNVTTTQRYAELSTKKQENAANILDDMI
jgi:integrase/recombinase XerC